MTKRKLKQKKRYLQGVINGLDRKAWEIDISIEGRKAIREGVRQHYDRKQEIVNGAKERITKEKKREDGKMDMELIKKLTALVAQHEPEILVLSGQIEAMDWDIDHEPKKMPAGELKKVIDGMKDLDKEFQVEVFKTLDVIENKDKGGLKQIKEQTIEYQRLVQRMINQL